MTRKQYYAAPVLLLVALGLSSKGARSETAATYRRTADHCLAAHQYEQAVQNFRLEAAVYRKLGDVNAARCEERKADRWSTTLGLYTTTLPDRSAALSSFTGAKFEPVYGCYLGAYVEADDRLHDTTDAEGSLLKPEQAFGERVGKRFATFFVYCHYGNEDFPRWAKELSRHGMTPHIALEPNNGLGEVQDNEYLRNFARQAALCHGPVFLRFAAEMNGDWTAYHNDPALYREKFKLVHDVMARIAPNVAMIWCPNSIPEDNIDQYYPGDEAVDWVGINLYSVLHHNNDRTVPGLEDPTHLLKGIYDRYSSRKPIAICEYSASHRESLAPAVDRSDVAAAKIAEMYSALPRLFPRIKLIDIFDCDNLKHARAGRQLNDYSVTDSPVVLDAFRKMVSSDYFLSRVYTSSIQQGELPDCVRTLGAGAPLTGRVPISVSLQTFDDNAVVVYDMDSQVVGRSHKQGDYSIMLNTEPFKPGKHVLTATAFDSSARPIGHKAVVVTVGSQTTREEAGVMKVLTPPAELNGEQDNNPNQKQSLPVLR